MFGAIGQSTMGDDAAAPASDPQVVALQRELNRFGPQAPVGLRFVPDAIAVTGVLDANTAAHAVTILQWRYKNAIDAFPGETDTALSKLKQVTSSQAVTNPVGFVGSDLGSITMLLRKYGDANGLPKVQPTVTEMLSSLADPTALVAVGAAALLAIYLGSK